MSAARFAPEGREQPVLLNPGPINVTDGVARALLRGDLCHREPEFQALQARIRARLLEAFAPGDEYTTVLITGSGTAAVEAAVSSIPGPDERVLVLENGVYGERLGHIARAHGLPHTALVAPWTAPQDPAALAAALEADPTIRVVLGVHHETTTGLLNPVRELAAVCREAGVTFVLDAISATAGEELDVPGWGLDVVVGTANKCIRGLPGLSFVLLRRDVMARCEQHPPRTLYLNLGTYHRAQEAGGVPFTPAVQVGYAFDQALGELLEEGVAARVEHMGALSRRLRAGFARLGLEHLLPAAARSRTITTLLLPAGWSYDALHDALRAEGWVIYAGQGELRQRAFRIANMGVMDEDDCERLLASLERVLTAGAAR